MKTRFILKEIMFGFLLIFPWLIITLPQYLNIQDVKENAEQYIILDAMIIDIAHSSVKNEETYVEYEYNQQKCNTFVELDLFDYFIDSTKIAVDKDSGQVIRMQIAISLWQWASVVIVIGYMIKAGSQYIEQVEKRNSRIESMYEVNDAKD